VSYSLYGSEMKCPFCLKPQKSTPSVGMLCGNWLCELCGTPFSWKSEQGTFYHTSRDLDEHAIAQGRQDAITALHKTIAEQACKISELEKERSKLLQNRREEGSSMNSRIDIVTKECSRLRDLLTASGRERNELKEKLLPALRLADDMAAQSDKHRRDSDEKTAQIVNLSAHLSVVEGQRDNLISDIAGAHKQAREALPDYPWRAHCSETVGATAHEAVWALRTALEGTNLANGDCHKRIQELEANLRGEEHRVDDQAGELRIAQEKITELEAEVLRWKEFRLMTDASAACIEDLKKWLEKSDRDKKEWEGRANAVLRAKDAAELRVAQLQCQLSDCEKDRDNWSLMCQNRDKEIEALKQAAALRPTVERGEISKLHLQLQEVEQDRQEWRSECQETRKRVQQLGAENVRLKDQLIAKGSVIDAQMVKIQGMCTGTVDTGFVTKDNCAHVYQTNVCLTELLNEKKAENVKLKDQVIAKNGVIDAQIIKVNLLKEQVTSSNNNWMLSAEGAVKLKRELDAMTKSVNEQVETIRHLQELLTDARKGAGREDVRVKELEAKIEQLEEVTGSQIDLTCAKHEQVVRAEHALIRIKKLIDEVLKEEGK
jgi:hypothetical protein